MRETKLLPLATALLVLSQLPSPMVKAQVAPDPATVKVALDAVPAERWELSSTNDLLLATADHVDRLGLTALANAGDPRAQQLLGYALAEHAQRNAVRCAAGLAWLRRAADQDYPRAKHTLGYLYQEGSA
jgi:TPR repeat protein